MKLAAFLFVMAGGLLLMAVAFGLLLMSPDAVSHFDISDMMAAGVIGLLLLILLFSQPSSRRGFQCRSHYYF